LGRGVKRTGRPHIHIGVFAAEHLVRVPRRSRHAPHLEDAQWQIRYRADIY
jgi:hypothetical protein